MFLSGYPDNCLVKEDHSIKMGKRQIFLDTNVDLLTAVTCAKSCSENKDCTAFQFKDYGFLPTCLLFQSGAMWQNPLNTHNVTSGLCPKVNDFQFGRNIAVLVENIPIKAPNLQCIKNDPSKLCHFPFLYKGKLQWDSIKNESGQCKCSSVDQNIDKLVDHSGMDNLTDCGYCNSGQYMFKFPNFVNKFFDFKINSS